jgi:hypothetical protein
VNASSIHHIDSEIDKAAMSALPKVMSADPNGRKVLDLEARKKKALDKLYLCRKPQDYEQVVKEALDGMTE